MTTQPGTTRNASPFSHRAVWPGWLIVFFATAALYGLTASRGAQWQDSGSNILRIVTGESVHPLGLALSHPLHHWLGRLIVRADIVEPCLAVTLISSLAGAVAVANVFGCVRTLTGKGPAALVAAGSLAMAHTFWQLSTVAEMYTLAAALVAGEFWCLSRYALARRQGFLLGAFFLNGLGVANHLLAGLTTPVLLIVLAYATRRKTLGLRGVALAVGLWLFGSLPYSAMVCAECVRTGDVTGTFLSALFGRHFAGAVLSTSLPGRQMLISLAFVVLNFPNLWLPVAGYGVGGSGRVRVPVMVRRSLLAGLLLHAAFAFRYPVVDQHTFFLPTYVLLAIFGGIGFAGISKSPRLRLRRRVLGAAVTLLALTPLTYSLVPSIAKRLNVLQSVARNKPYRDDYKYLFTPWSIAERSADRLSRHALELAGHGGLILVEDTMAEFAVRYRAIRAGLDTVTITSGFTGSTIVEAAAAQRPVVLVPYSTDQPRTQPPVGSWRRDGDLYVLRREQ